MPTHQGVELFQQHAIKLKDLTAPWVSTIKSIAECHRKLNEILNTQTPLDDVESLNVYAEFIEEIAYDKGSDVWIKDPLFIFNTEKAPLASAGIYQNAQYQGRCTLESGEYLRLHELQKGLHQFYTDVWSYREQINILAAHPIDKKIEQWIDDKEIPDPRKPVQMTVPNFEQPVQPSVIDCDELGLVVLTFLMGCTFGLLLEIVIEIDDPEAEPSFTWALGCGLVSLILNFPKACPTMTASLERFTRSTLSYAWRHIRHRDNNDAEAQVNPPPIDHRLNEIL